MKSALRRWRLAAVFALTAAIVFSGSAALATNPVVAAGPAPLVATPCEAQRDSVPLAAAGRMEEMLLGYGPGLAVRVMGAHWCLYGSTMVVGPGGLGGSPATDPWRLHPETTELLLAPGTIARPDSSSAFGLAHLTYLDAARLDTRHVTNMTGLFSGATGLTSLDLSGWDTRAVTQMGNMFLGTANLTTLRFGTGFLAPSANPPTFGPAEYGTRWTRQAPAETITTAQLIARMTTPGNYGGAGLAGTWTRESAAPALAMTIRHGLIDQVPGTAWADLDPAERTPDGSFAAIVPAGSLAYHRVEWVATISNTGDATLLGVGLEPGPGYTAADLAAFLGDFSLGEDCRLGGAPVTGPPTLAPGQAMVCTGTRPLQGGDAPLSIAMTAVGFATDGATTPLASATDTWRARVDTAGISLTSRWAQGDPADGHNWRLTLPPTHPTGQVWHLHRQVELVNIGTIPLEALSLTDLAETDSAGFQPDHGASGCEVLDPAGQPDRGPQAGGWTPALGQLVTPASPLPPGYRVLCTRDYEAYEAHEAEPGNPSATYSRSTRVEGHFSPGQGAHLAARLGSGATLPSVDTLVGEIRRSEAAPPTPDPSPTGQPTPLPTSNTYPAPEAEYPAEVPLPSAPAEPAPPLEQGGGESRDQVLEAPHLAHAVYTETAVGRPLTLLSAPVVTAAAIVVGVVCLLPLDGGKLVLPTARKTSPVRLP
ncbi:MAG: BspA family leucine-rich repeat surface protein [Promicromonosporaceae bacterium]|nr:BspA family leucine-rich repeat surface protein [Promicromonosporaceae bacterium]